jgi:hypothetical protein
LREAVVKGVLRTMSSRDLVLAEKKGANLRAARAVQASAAAKMKAKS